MTTCNVETGDLPQRVSRITLVEAVTRLKDAVDAVPARPLVVEYPEGDQVSTSIIVIRCRVSFYYVLC